MNVLVINCGSSSLKYQLFNMNDESVLAKGLVERIGIDGSKIKHETTGKEKKTIETPLKDHKDALKLVLDTLVNKEYGAISSLDEIDAAGHRVVHGGEYYSESVIIDDVVMQAIQKCCELAPLHNPPNIIGINAIQELLPNIKNVAVFDTAFHQTMPLSAYIYPIPYEYYEKYDVRRYGFHGTSHKYVSSRAAEILGIPIEELKIITCHLGNGASVAAVKGGKSINTSMGFTPLEGLVMGTRCGDIDPAIIPYIMEKEDMSLKTVNDMMNKKSGVLGVSGISSDFRDIEKAAEEHNMRADLSLEIFDNMVRRYISSYASDLDGVDVIVFTAGLGENSPANRKRICKNLRFMGVEIDDGLNAVRGKEAVVSTPASKVKVMVIPTNEELVIARDTSHLISK